MCLQGMLFLRGDARSIGLTCCVQEETGTGEGTDQHVMATQLAGMPLFVSSSAHLFITITHIDRGWRRREEAGGGEEIHHHNLH